MKNILEELKSREPIFHQSEFGTTRADFKKMTVDDYWEIGASGNRYEREEIIETVVARYQDPDYIKNDFWETSDFECRELSDDTYLLTYILIQGKEKRITRRSTIWKNNHGQWMIVYHQGTVVGGKKVDES
ncbi:MAG: hypothetical protein Q8L78_07065 [Coxiellaceae bacterium]|nr:hypothetical protein [Coxiellaceae bacterium]